MTTSTTNNIVLLTLSIFLGVFFIFYGILKVSPIISVEMHREIRRSFVKFAKVTPVLSQLGYKVSPKLFRLTIGYFEIVCGFVLIVVPGRIKLLANSLLILSSITSIYSHLMVKDKFERFAPCIVFTLMLTCRLVVHWQVYRRERRIVELTEKLAQANVIKQDTTSDAVGSSKAKKE